MATLRARLAVAAAVLSTSACALIVGADFDAPAVSGSAPEDGQAPVDAVSKPGPDGAVNAPDAATNPFSRGCSFCQSHVQQNGACWDFDCTTAEAGALANGWTTVAQLGGELELTAGHLDSSQPNAARSSLRLSSAGSTAQVFLGDQFLLDGGTETTFEFDLDPAVACEGDQESIVDLALISFETQAAATTLQVEIGTGPAHDLLGLIGCASCNCGPGCTTDLTGDQDVTFKDFGPAPTDWAHLRIGVSGPSTNAVVTITLDTGTGPQTLWSQAVASPSPSKLTVQLGMQKESQNAQVTQCASTYDNVVLNFQ